MKPDHTALSALERCEQEFVWRHQRHLAPTAPEAAPLFGQVVHVGVRALYEGAPLEEGQRRMRAAWNADAAHAVANVLGNGLQSCVQCGGLGGAVEQAGVRISPTIGRTCSCATPDFVWVPDPARLHLTLWRAQHTVLTYAATWGAGGALGAALETPRKLGPFRCVWNEGYAESADAKGLPDRCVRHDADGLLYAMDLKTTGMNISEEWCRSFEHSQQAAIQLELLEAELGESVAGFWLDAIHVSRTALPKPEHYRRDGPMPYSSALRAELKQQRLEKAQRMGDLLAYPSIARKSTSACVRFTKLCPYFALCRTDPRDREAFLAMQLRSGQLKVEPWEPSAR